jgi:tetraacyldisaccharide 4'-kinase
VKAPAFWWRERPTLAAWLLRPLAALFGYVSARRLRRAGARAGIPVICVGNVVAGGAGKTPTVLALVERLGALGEKPVILSRGHGGRLAGPVAVNPERHEAGDVGDEPLLMAHLARVPVVVARERAVGAAFIREQMPECGIIVMDDGMQNPSLAKDLTLAVVDGGAGIGNGFVMPAGPLRAKLSAQAPLVGALLIVGPARHGSLRSLREALAGRPVMTGALMPDADIARSLRGTAVMAFAGIGRPEKFFETLEQAGARIVARHAFPDHHPFSEAELVRLREEAQARGARLVTTQKDAMRLDAVWRERVTALPVRLAFDDDGALDALLTRALGRA